jgi:D-galactarolactone cycloisomerase
MNWGEPEQHCIHRIHIVQVQSSYPRVVGRNARRGVHGVGSTAQVCVISTDRGALGWGISKIAGQEIPGLVGRCVATLFDPAVGVVAPEAKRLDFALHDLAGVILDQPVYQLLGSDGIATLPCYDGAIYMDDLLPVDGPRGVGIVLGNCRHDCALGYRAFKLKIGRGYRWMEPEEGLRRDIEVTRQVREYFPDCAILVDGNDGYTCERFLRYLDAVADCELFWVEEPFPENRRDLARLREFLEKRSPLTPVADGKSRYDVELLLSLSREGLPDVLVMDIAGLGFSPWRQWMPLGRRGRGICITAHLGGSVEDAVCGPTRRWAW